MIEAKNITKSYSNKQNKFIALDDINLALPTGASVSILGKSGSGKSTLMHALSGLDRPQSGQILVDGRDILQMKDKEVNRFRVNEIGFIFQSFYVQGNETVYHNVSLPLEVAGVPRNKRPHLIEEALAAVELSDKKLSRAKDLSGGQRQRLAIARAIVNQPRIIFADEPTGNLDSATSKVIEDLLFNYNKSSNVTLLIVTHDAELAAKCDMTIHIKDGSVIHARNEHSLN